jgi:hypothetical protein
MCNRAGPKKITEWFNHSCFETAALAQALANRTPRSGDSGTQYPKYSRGAKLGYAFIKKANVNSGTTGTSGESSSMRVQPLELWYTGEVIGTSTAGVISSSGSPRNFQLAVKLEF